MEGKSEMIRSLTELGAIKRFFRGMSLIYQVLTLLSPPKGKLDHSLMHNSLLVVLDPLTMPSTIYSDKEDPKSLVRGLVVLIWRNSIIPTWVFLIASNVF